MFVFREMLQKMMEFDPQIQGVSCQFSLQPILSLGFLDKSPAKNEELTSNLFAASVSRYLRPIISREGAA